jgi:hypothetical protein
MSPPMTFLSDVPVGWRVYISIWTLLGLFFLNAESVTVALTVCMVGAVGGWLLAPFVSRQGWPVVCRYLVASALMLSAVVLGAKGVTAKKEAAKWQAELATYQIKMLVFRRQGSPARPDRRDPTPAERAERVRVVEKRNDEGNAFMAGAVVLSVIALALINPSAVRRFLAD